MADTAVALITGASRGIGRAVALALARDGHDIAAVARPHAGGDGPCHLGTLGDEVESLGRRYTAVHADIADLGAHERILSKVAERLGRIDLLVSNAGVAPEIRRDVLEMTPESYDRVMGVNLRGALFLAQQVARVMLTQTPLPEHPARIVFITSVSAGHSSTNRAEYCISKAGLSMAARVFADRLAAEGIGVFEVRPGIIQTDMTASAQEKYERLIADGLVPQRRWGQPGDVARAVTAIARGDFDYSTGTIIDVDGGLSLPRL